MARQQQSKKPPKPRTDGDCAAIRQRKSYRKQVMATMPMTAGTVTETTYTEATAPGKRKKGGGKVVTQARIVARHRTVEKVAHDPTNRNARINGLTVGDSWKLAGARS